MVRGISIGLSKKSLKWDSTLFFVHYPEMLEVEVYSKGIRDKKGDIRASGDIYRISFKELEKLLKKYGKKIDKKESLTFFNSKANKKYCSGRRMSLSL